jgi:methylmalonyl-CoA/ethylmalonyl-CoA epimerase
VTEPDLTLDHIGIATNDLDTGSLPYQALGLQPEGPDEVVPNAMVIVRAYHAGGTLIELLAPTSPDSPIARFLETRGPGMHHAAFKVPDIHAALERLSKQGARLIDTTPRPGRAGTLVAFIHPKWAAGTLIELVQHPKEKA